MLGVARRRPFPGCCPRCFGGPSARRPERPDSDRPRAPHAHAAEGAADPARRASATAPTSCRGCRCSSSRGTRHGQFVGRAARYAVRVAPTWAEIRPAAPVAKTNAAPPTVTMRFEGADGRSPCRVGRRRPRRGSATSAAPTRPRWRTLHDLPQGPLRRGLSRHRRRLLRDQPRNRVRHPRRARRRSRTRRAPFRRRRFARHRAKRRPVDRRGPGDAHAARARRLAGRRAAGAPPVAVRYARTSDRTVGLVVGDYDRTAPLVIDPILSYAALLGGTGLDEAVSIAVDAADNVYLAGTTSSANFPGAPGSSSGLDVFVAKLELARAPALLRVRRRRRRRRGARASPSTRRATPTSREPRPRRTSPRRRRARPRTRRRDRRVRLQAVDHRRRAAVLDVSRRHRRR